jgi:hypothetical protein
VTTIPTYSLEDVGAGDFMVQQTVMMEGPDRWAVMKFNGRGWYVQYTCKTRADAKREALREWRAVLAYHRRARARGYW